MSANIQAVAPRKKLNRKPLTRNGVYELLQDHLFDAPKLNVGCGLRHLYGCENVDTNPDVEPDVVADFSKYLPYETGTVNYVSALSVMEHIKDFFGALGEVWRVLRPGGRFEVFVPYWAHRAAWEDPTHCRAFGPESYIYFNAALYALNTSWYTADRFNFRMVERQAMLVPDGVWGAAGETDAVAPATECHGVDYIRYLFFRFEAIPLPADTPPEIKVYGSPEVVA